MPRRHSSIQRRAAESAPRATVADYFRWLLSQPADSITGCRTSHRDYEAWAAARTA